MKDYLPALCALLGPLAMYSLVHAWLLTHEIENVPLGFCLGLFIGVLFFAAFMASLGGMLGVFFQLFVYPS